MKTVKEQLICIKDYLEHAYSAYVDDETFNRCYFLDMLDSMCKGGLISDKVCDNTYLTQKNNNFYITYKSQKIKFTPVVIKRYYL